MEVRVYLLYAKVSNSSSVHSIIINNVIIATVFEIECPVVVAHMSGIHNV